jgi:hypothetical protein
VSDGFCLVLSAPLWYGAGVLRDNPAARYVIRVSLGSKGAMLYPTPRVDRWDPWLVGALLVALIAAAAAIRFF